MPINDLTADNNTPQPKGLIDPAPSSNGGIVGAAQWNVSPDQTVESRIESIIKKSSPLMQLAESRAAARMNERGLLNSSLAIGAGQTALYEAAMPMAQQDAATYARASEFNASQKNQFSLQSNDNINMLGRMATTQGYTVTNAEIAAAAQSARDQVAIKADKDTASTLAQTNAERDRIAIGASKEAAAKLAETQLNYGNVQITANKAAALFSANVQSELAQLNHDNSTTLNKSNYAVNAMSKYSDALNNIAMSTLSPEAKVTAQENAFKAYKDQLRLVSSLGNVEDLSKLLDFSSGSAPTSSSPVTPDPRATNVPTPATPDYVVNTQDKGQVYQPYGGGKGLIEKNSNISYQ